MTIHSSPPEPFGRMPENQELLELVAARCNGTATAEQWERLNALIVSEPEALEFYVAHLSMHAALSRMTADLPEVGDSTGILAEVSSQSDGPTTDAPFQWEGPDVRSRTVSRRTVRPWLWNAPAILLVAFFAVKMTSFDNSFHRPVHGAQAWLMSVDGEPAFRPIASGDGFKQVDGTSELLFRNGVHLKLSGPSELEVLSGTEVRLRSGQLQADVGPSGKGFRVLTETADVIDLGTVFGIQATPSGKTDVIVFQGEVKYRSPDADASLGGSPSLLQGEAVRVQPDGSRSRIQTIWQDPVSMKWSTERPVEIDSPIAAVYDSLTDEKSSKYYVVVPRGFDEDAKVYADRNYEWNSLKGSELPYELVGADYIRTFNDDKYNEILELQLELNCASIVYVLWDPRHLAPDWIRDEFELTGLRLGMDIGTQLGGPHEPVAPPGVEAVRYLGTGPGRSVDIPFVVWRKVIPQAGTVTLGPNGEKSKALLGSKLRSPGSMYGIVVRPLRSASLDAATVSAP